MDNKSASQNTLDETFESITPLEAEEPPAIEQVETPPPLAIKSETNKIKNRLSALASPFKTSKNFHLGSIKRGKNSDKEDADSEKESKDAVKPSKKTKKVKPEEAPMSDDNAAETEGGGGEEDKAKEKKKKRGARSRAGALVKRLGSLGGRRGGEAASAAVAAGVAGVAERRSSGSSSLTPTSVKRLTPDGEDGPVSEPSLNDESGSRYGSVENVIPSQDMPTPVDSAEDPPIITDTENIATTHPVSTLPFVVSTWKPKAKSEIEKPIESPSPEDALRRRIAFVAQATVCLSEDQEDLDDDKLITEIEGSPATRLSRMVELARQQKRSESPGTKSSTPTPGPSGEQSHISQEAEKTDDEEYEDTEESRLIPNISPQSHMPPFGDLIDGSDNPHLNMGSGSSSNPAPLGGDRREHLYKILVIGELGTGKTSIIKRYVHQFFSQHYRATIGVDFALKVLNWDPNTTIRLQLWDIAGQERFGNMTRVYYKEAVGAFIVFDVTRVATFEAVVKWKQDLDSKVQLPDGSPIPCILLANKCDQQKEGIVNTPTKMDEYCREKGFAGWYETSAKENINIEEAARSLVNKILLNDKLIQSSDSRDGERFAIDGRNGTESATTSKSCAC